MISLHNDCDYIYDELAVAEYGWIFKEFEFPDIDSASALLYAAGLKLAGGINQGVSLELTTIDLSMVNVDIQKFQVGDMARSVSKPHDLDAFLSVSKKERDLLEPGNDKIALGSVTQSLTDRISGPLGGGIMGFVQTTANTVKNMEFVSNELSFMVKITADAVTATESRLDEAEFKITATAITSTVRSSIEYIADLGNKASVTDLNSKADATALGSLTSRVDTAEQKITSTAIISTVTQSSTYTNAMTGKANKVTLISEINQSAEGIKISADKIAITGTVTFAEAQSLANTAQTNATNAAATYASNARSGAVSDVNTNLATAGYTTINGANISTGTISCNKISGGTLNFTNIQASGSIVLDSSSTYAGMAFRHTPSGNFGGVYANGSYGAVLYAGSGGIQLSTGGSDVTVTYSLKANNLIYTATSGTEKISDIKWVAGYVQVGTTSGAKGITVWDSDRRLKANIKASNINALALLSTTQLRSFNWISDNRYERCGFVAQEIEAILGKEFVLKVRQEDGSINYQIKEYPFIPLLVKAVQELNQTKIQQAHDIAILKAQIKELKGDTIC